MGRILIRESTGAANCEDGDEPLDMIKCGEFLD